MSIYIYTYKIRFWHNQLQDFKAIPPCRAGIWHLLMSLHCKITYNLVLILVRIMTTRYHDQGSE